MPLPRSMIGRTLGGCCVVLKPGTWLVGGLLLGVLSVLGQRG